MQDAQEFFAFGCFRLDRRRRVLHADGVPVVLQSRAFDLLEYLVENRDRVIGRADIESHVWRGMAMAQNNVTVQMSTLRRTLAPFGGDGLIITVAGVGYRFVGDVRELPAEAPAVPAENIAMAGSPATLEMSPARQIVRTGLPLRLRDSRRFAWAMVTLLLCAALVGAGLRGWRLFAPAPPRLSIVVLPFANRSSDPDQDYLADAISDDLTTDLAHIPGSTVIARGSAEMYRAHPASAQAVGRALNVRYLLEGSLRREGAGLHIDAQLVDTATGKTVWPYSFDVAADQLGQARAEIVQRLASVMNFEVVEIEAARSMHERPNDPDAIDLFLRARWTLRQDTGMPGLVEAQHLLEQAVAREPSFGDALAELGLVLIEKMDANDDIDQQRDHVEALDVIARANQDAPKDPLAIEARGWMAQNDQRCDQAIPSFELALTLDASNTDARDGIAVCSLALGRMQPMIDNLKDLMRVDPASVSGPYRENLIGLGLLLLERPQEALDWLRRVHASFIGQKEDGGAFSPHEWNSFYLIAAFQEIGDTASARSILATYRALWPHRTIWQMSSFGATRAIAGLPGYARFTAALKQAGLREFADEDEDFGVQPSLHPLPDLNFGLTPRTIPGGLCIRTSALHALLSGVAPPAVLDLGRGTATIPGAMLVWPMDTQDDQNILLDTAVAQARRSAGGRGIVVMGDGPFQTAVYNAALKLIGQRNGPVLWYRGGEEAWAAAGYPAQDLRPQ